MDINNHLNRKIYLCHIFPRISKRSHFCHASDDLLAQSLIGHYCAVPHRIFTYTKQKHKKVNNKSHCIFICCSIFIQQKVYILIR